MKWLVENNTISQLDFNGENLILPWGIETADSSSFYSLEEGFGWRYQELSKDLSFDAASFCARVHVRMNEGEWELQVDDKVEDAHTVTRSASLHCLQETSLMDFVVRFRFKSALFQRAVIAEREYMHDNTNVYYQYPVKAVQLAGEKYRASVTVLDCKAPEMFAPHLYVRDNIGEWVLHARMLPTRYQKVVVKLCNPWYGTRPLPQMLANGLLAIPGVRRALWYRCERRPYKGRIMRRVNPQAIPIARVKAGTTLSWKMQLKVAHAS